MGYTLAAIGVILVIVALLIHFVITGITLFPHASLVIGIVGGILAVVGAFFVLRPGAAK